MAREPGESKQLSFTLAAQQLARADEQGHQVLKPGTVRLEMSGCSPGSRGMALGAPSLVSVELELRVSRAEVQN